MSRALIAGAGIAGPALATALREVGEEVVLFESRARPDDHQGAFLNMASNGLDALHTLGVRDVATRSDGFDIPRLVFRNGKGKRLGEVANGRRLENGIVSTCVKRGMLHRELRAEATARGAEIRFEKRLARYAANDGGGVTAFFEDGATAVGDYLVGADGVGSAVRRQLDPAAPAPRFTGLLSTGGYSQMTGLDPTTDTQHFVFGKNAFFGYLVREGGEVYWFANMHRDAAPTRQELAALTQAEWIRLHLDLFDRDLAVVNEIIAATTSPIAGYAVWDIPTSPVWSDEIAVLVGDAVHAVSPSSGQGASIALEDAVVLAKCIAESPTNRRRAFELYETLRRHRVERVVAYSKKRSDSKAAGPVGRVFRDLFMPLGLRFSASESAHAWLYDYHISWDRSPQ